MITEQLQSKLDYYEQVYNALDTPIPFKGDLKIHPVIVNDYYLFYSCLPCLTMDKTVKEIQDEFGRVRKVADIEGLQKTYMEYLISKMSDKEKGQSITAQVIGLFELVFKIPRGLYCPECGEEVKYSDALNGMEEYVSQQKKEAQEIFANAIKKQEEETGKEIEQKELPKELLQKIEQKAYYDFYQKAMTCPKCQKQLRDIYSVKTDNGTNWLLIKNIEISSDEFEELKAIIPRQNILDYDGDKYVDPDLKEELEIKSQMQNKDYTSPTLEKQLLCAAIGTGWSIDYLKTITMRKLSMLLRLIDRKNTYYAQLQASMSGFVKFKEGTIKHWMFTDDKKNIKDELTSLDSFKDKFKMVT